MIEIKAFQEFDNKLIIGNYSSIDQSIINYCLFEWKNNILSITLTDNNLILLNQYRGIFDYLSYNSNIEKEPFIKYLIWNDFKNIELYNILSLKEKIITQFKSNCLELTTVKNTDIDDNSLETYNNISNLNIDDINFNIIKKDNTNLKLYRTYIQKTVPIYLFSNQNIQFTRVFNAELKINKKFLGLQKEYILNYNEYEFNKIVTILNSKNYKFNYRQPTLDKGGYFKTNNGEINIVKDIYGIIYGDKFIDLDQNEFNELIQYYNEQKVIKYKL